MNKATHIPLDDRASQILKLVVDAYMATGAPVGSKAIAEKLGSALSPATIRATMAAMEERGLLYAPHTSAGRLPTESGLTVCIEGLLELDHLSPAEQEQITQKIYKGKNAAPTAVMEETGHFLSGLSSCAGLVFAPKAEEPVRHIDFVLLSPGRVLAVLVTRSGQVENRLLDVTSDITATTLMQAANFLNARMADKTLAEAAGLIHAELKAQRHQLDAMTRKLVENGIAAMVPQDTGGHLIIKGRSKLLEDITAIEDLERVRGLIDALDTRETMLKLLQATTGGEGVRIYIGTENKLFGHSGCAMIVAPYKSADARVIGAIGVIGPTRMNYRRVIPVVNYTSSVIGRLLSEG